MLETEVCGEVNGTICRFNHLKVGGLDSSGRKIEQIVYLEPDKYIIYFVEGEYLKPFYIDAYDFFAPFSEEFQEKLSEVRSINIRNERQNEFMRQEVASAYYNALNGYNKVAIGELEILKGKLIYRAYVWWFTTYAVLCILLTIITFTVHFISADESITKIIYAINASSIGGMLVHTRKENKAGITTFLPTMAAYIYFFASVVSGFLVYCVLESNLLLGGFSENRFSMILVCFVAGYSEDIPLKLIDKIGSLLDSSKTKDK